MLYNRDSDSRFLELPLARFEICCIFSCNNVCSQVVYTVNVDTAEPFRNCTNCKTSITLAGLIGHTIQITGFNKVKTLFGDTSCYNNDVITTSCFASFYSTDCLVRVISQNDCVQIITKFGNPVSNNLFFPTIRLTSNVRSLIILSA